MAGWIRNRTIQHPSTEYLGLAFLMVSLAACGNGAPSPYDAQATMLAGGPQQRATNDTQVVQNNLNRAINAATSAVGDIEATRDSRIAELDHLATDVAPPPTALSTHASVNYVGVDPPRPPLSTDVKTPKPPATAEPSPTASITSTPAVDAKVASCHAVRTEGKYDVTLKDGSKTSAFCKNDVWLSDPNKPDSRLDGTKFVKISLIK